jgi:hypothetical protein
LRTIPQMLILRHSDIVILGFGFGRDK